MKSLRTIILLLLILTLTAGCGSGRQHTNEKQWSTGRGELSSFIGDPETDHLIADEEFMEKFDMTGLGYASFTGRWFLHNGSGKFGYGISSGTMKIGENASVSLIAATRPVKVDRDVRIQLQQYMGAAEPLKMIREEVVHVDTVDGEKRIFTYPVPRIENAAYVFRAEILDDAGQPEDTLVSSFFVPAQEIHAKLTTDQSAYRAADGTATLMLKNAGPTVFTFGTPYTIEKLVDQQWRIVPSDTQFNAIGIQLAPGKTYEQSFKIDTLKKGQYRIVKTFYVQGMDAEVTLAAEFSIE